MLQVQAQSIRPLTTAHLAQTMTLLALSNLELRDKVLGELASNPALELLEDRVCPACHRHLPQPGPCPACSRPQSEDGPIVFLSPRESAFPRREPQGDDQPAEREPAAPEDLAVHVLQQLAAELDPADRYLAAYILSSLDEDGFLQDHPAILARTTRSTPAQVERVLALIARADPPGLATTGPRQALLVQLDQHDPSSSLTQLARRILEQAFAELGRHEYERMAQTLDVPLSRIRQAAAFIQDTLNPYPARAYWGSGRQPQSTDPNVYHNPDIHITYAHNNGDADAPLVVEIFAAVAGWLRVNPMFRQAAPEGGDPVSEEWARHLERAALFVKCMQQRNNTMRRMLEILVRHQREFILNGDRFLEPMTRARLAVEIGVHESTISRAVSHKSVGLPDGRIIPLDRFFDRSLSVRDRIKEIVEQESRPLTDDEIVDRLRKQDVLVARRTVAKYRAIEGILPARLRHRKKEQPTTIRV
jgi:RNA polymerase sigma-54 factor